MRRDDLKAAVDAAGLEQMERRSVQSMRDALARSRAEKTVFNYMATYNGFERQFAEFLVRAPDILRFAALGTTEQGVSGTTFRVGYLKPSGAIGFYYPDWVAMQRDLDGVIVNWVIETKDASGRVRQKRTPPCRTGAAEWAMPRATYGNTSA